MKISKWHIEYTATLLVIFAIALIVMPTSFNPTRQANLTAKWKDCYKNIIYTHDVILKHEKEDLLTSFKRAKDKEEREKLMLELVKPYFRLSDFPHVPSKYHAKYMNNKNITKEDLYYVKDHYFASNNMIVGIKDIPDKNDDTAFLMTFDVNGLLPPNTWGKDVFGVKVHSTEVRAIGEKMTPQALVNDCSLNGSGTGCSYYYLIGGSFDD